MRRLRGLARHADDAARATETAVEPAPLTACQAEVYGLMVRHQKECRGQSITLRAIMRQTGIRSQNGVVCHMKAMIRKGYVERVECSGGKARYVAIEGMADV